MLSNLWLPDFVADYDVNLQGIDSFFKVPQIFCSNKKNWLRYRECVL